MQYKILTVLAVLLFSFAFATTGKLEKNKAEKTEAVKSEEPTMSSSPKSEIENLYDVFSEKNANMPSLAIFEKGMRGYTKLLESGTVKNTLLTVIDFGLSSNEKRLWTLDMATNKVIFNTYVSHGQNTGDEFATEFSNTVNSFQSSLGFYTTAETYYGKNGLSLFIDGQEKGFNTRARERYVVIHGADYATPEFIQKFGRLGRSQGCPAVPHKEAKKLINTIKGESVVYIHKDDDEYLEKSTFIN